MPSAPWIAYPFCNSSPLKVAQPKRLKRSREFDFSAAARQVAAKIAASLPPPVPELPREMIAHILAYVPSETARQIDRGFREHFKHAPRSCGGRFYGCHNGYFNRALVGTGLPNPMKSGVFFKKEVRIFNEYATAPAYHPAKHDFVCYGRKMCADCYEREEQREHELHQEMEHVRQRRQAGAVVIVIDDDQ